MARQKKNNRGRKERERRLVVRGIRRDPPDLTKLSKALLALAAAEAERQAEAQHAAEQGAEDTGDMGESGSPESRGEADGQQSG